MKRFSATHLPLFALFLLLAPWTMPDAHAEPGDCVKTRFCAPGMCTQVNPRTGLPRGCYCPELDCPLGAMPVARDGVCPDTCVRVRGSGGPGLQCPPCPPGSGLASGPPSCLCRLEPRFDRPPLPWMR